jgi:hypothetical protein
MEGGFLDCPSWAVLEKAHKSNIVSLQVITQATHA